MKTYRTKSDAWPAVYDPGGSRMYHEYTVRLTAKDGHVFTYRVLAENPAAAEHRARLTASDCRSGWVGCVVEEGWQ